MLKISLIFLLIIFGTNILVILVKSLISFSANAISTLFNKKLELKKDFNDNNKFSLDKIISFFLTKIFGFFNFIIKLKSVGLRYIFVLLNFSL